MKRTQLLLLASLAANLALVAALVLGAGRGTASNATPQADAGTAASSPALTRLCDKAKGDLDFFIDGLEKAKDPFYSPLSIRTLGHVLVECIPFHAKPINDVMPYLREQMVLLIAVNSTDAQKTSAHDEVLRILREFRARFDTGA